MIAINLRTKNQANRKKYAFAVTFFIITILVSSFSQAHENIIDGTPTGENEFEAVFVIKMTSESGHSLAEEEESLCTAFLVHPRLLITAAHCLAHGKKVFSARNGPRTDTGTSLSISSSKANPDYIEDRPNDSVRTRYASGVNDIGYVLLREDAKGITPLEVLPTTDEASRTPWLGREATVIGYGANKWQKSGIYTSSAGFGTKRVGKKSISTVGQGLLILAGAENGLLPGDSGGPLLLLEGEKFKAIAINHKKSDAMVSTPYTPVFSKKTKYRLEHDHYESSITSPLTVKNLCWVEMESKIQIPGVDCP